jgi:hypothetical protein
VRGALSFSKYPDGRFFACAPTNQQAKFIFWSDLKSMVPDWAIMGGRERGVSDSELTIKLINGVIIKVAGLDRPARIEGRDWDGGVITEFGSCKAEVFDEHIRPMLMRGGWIDIEGVPEGRNHYYELATNVREGRWKRALFHTWTTEEVLHLWLGREAAEEEIAHAKATMDRLVYQQEYQAAFISFQGMAYYAYEREVNLAPEGERVFYDAELPLVLCFDFNHSPGTCAILQEQSSAKYPWLKGKNAHESISAAVDEVFIRRDSNTPKVVREVLQKYGQHPGEVHYYGDPSGGQKRSCATEGSDWDQIDKMLKAHYGHRAKNCVLRAPPGERARLNAMNSRLCSVDGHVGLVADRKQCVETIHDFEGVEADNGGNLVKDEGSPRTHLTDAIGYYVHEKHPIYNAPLAVEQI